MHISQGDIQALGLSDLVEQIKEFVDHYREHTKNDPNFVIRAPGRINLIGDHIDYHGFSVLPMAIKNSILMGLSVEAVENQLEALLTITNRDSQSYKPFQGKHSFLYGSQLDKSHQWHHYVLCGYHGVLVNQLLGIESDQVFKHSREAALNDLSATLHAKITKSLTLFIDSDLPPASGLSSSSALVCASALATQLFLENVKVQTKGPEIDSKSMAANCSKFEHLIGTNGGGMDQAVILTAQEGYAKHVEFVPEFNCTNVQLPESVVWLVSHCGSSYPKAATSGFNTRVLETKLGAAIILKSLCKSSSQLNLDHTLTLSKVKSEVFPTESCEEICKILREVVFSGAEHLSIDEICSRLEITRSQLITRFGTSEGFLVENNLDERVQLLKRCLHVFQEADRVEQFKSICDTSRDIQRLGSLMTESHTSLRDQYECSHPNLDRLVEISLKAGALGARLTGAGWGGCIVTMVESEKCEQVFLELEKVSKFTFQTEPRSGCTIIKVG